MALCNKLCNRWRQHRKPKYPNSSRINPCCCNDLP